MTVVYIQQLQAIHVADFCVQKFFFISPPEKLMWIRMMYFGALVHFFPSAVSVTSHSEPGWIRGRACRAAARGDNLKGTQEVAGVFGNGNMVPVNPGFHTRKNLSKDYSQFEYARPFLGRWK
jgi:hypothetical protein